MKSSSPLQRVTVGQHRWPLHDTAASRAAETIAMSHQHAPQALMERAGVAVARLSQALAPHARHITVFAGPGNNGGDGLVAARHLHARGRHVQVWLLADAARLPADAAQALRLATAAGVEVRRAASPATLPGHWPRTDLVIDAMIGLGSRRTPSGAIAAAITAINKLQVPTLAVDIPSGLHPDTGALLGSEAVRATATLSLLTLKSGCFTAEGRDHAGAVWFDDLGTTPPPATAWLLSAPAGMARPHAAHKGRFGDVIVVGGAPGMVGAAWLAARAALAAGAGRVYTSLLDTAAAGFDPQRPELMSRPAAWRLPPPELAAATVVCGCGAGQHLLQVLPPLLAHALRLVLDADALNAVAADTALRTLLQARGARQALTVLTPHPLEAARLLGCSTAEVQHDRLTAARTLAQDLGAVVVLKGSGTVIAAPGSPPGINGSGNAALATAGTGDVLAGWLGGLWAQQPDAAAVASAEHAVWLHGAAADCHLAAGRAGPLCAADLIDAMAALSLL